MTTPSVMPPNLTSNAASLGSLPPLANPGGSGIDPEAVRRAREEIQNLVREIAQLSKSDIEPAEFYEAMLSRVVDALAATSGAVWTLGDDGELVLAYQINLSKTNLYEHAQRQAQHAKLLKQVVANDRDALVPPNSGVGESTAAANPTESLLIVAPLKNDAGPQGVLEVFQRADTRPSTQRGYQRFVAQVAELAGDYLKSRRLRSLVNKQTQWENLAGFTCEVHRCLDLKRTAFTIANEGRRLIGCDRVSVLIQRGKLLQVEAISGQDTFDRRSNTVARLARLAGRVAATGEAVWYTGDASDLPPQVEDAMHAYIDTAHARLVAVMPLVAPSPQEDSNRPGRKPRRQVVGALVVEQIEDSQPAEGLTQRVEVVREHSATAIANAAEHENLFLMPVWKALGRMKWVVQARNLPKTLAIVAGFAAVLLGLMIVPADFQLESRGALQPLERRDVFAGIDGVVINVPVDHSDTVAEGQQLALLRNTDLEVRLTDLIGRRDAVGQQVRSMERAMLDQGGLTRIEQNRLSGELIQLRKSAESLDSQIALLRKKQQQLVVAAPIAGQVVSWQVRERLLRRPVRQGQMLMRVANPAGPWQLELHVPEDRMGHIAQAAASQNEPLRVEYIVATDPGTTHVGRVVEICSTAELRGDEGNTVLVRVAIDKQDLKDLRPGATVTARVDCGRRSLGYVWLHDVVAFVQSKILFRL